MMHAMARPTISDVARLAGVSKKTVSFVLNGRGGTSAETADRVREAIAALGFVPSLQARALASGTNATVALLHDGADADHWLLPAIHGAGRALAESPLALVVHQLSGGAAGLRRFIEDHRPRGLVLMPALAEQPLLSAMARELGTPVVGLSASVDPAAGDRVSVSERQASADAARYLVALGHARIGFIAGADGDEAAAAREEGFIDALGDDASLVAQGNGTVAGGMEAARLLLELSPRPSAILAADAAMAAGALAAARDAGIAVPGALSIMAAVDGIAASAVSPAISAMRVPVDLLAQAATLGIADPEAGARLPAQFYAELVVRGSTGPALPSRD